MKYSFIEDTDFVHRNHRRMRLIQQKAFKGAVTDKAVSTH